MKKILFLRDSKQEARFWVEFRDRLSSLLGNGYILEDGTYRDLTFEVSGSNAVVAFKGLPVEEFSLVIFNRVGEKISLAVPLADYCAAKSIPFIDKYIGKRKRAGKLGQAMLRWSAGFEEICTFYGNKEELIERFDDRNQVMILKDNNGKKGRDNFLIRSQEELKAVVDNKENETKIFILQEYIPNDGDFRLLVMNGEIKFAMLRKSAGNSHLNNTSQGGSATIIPLDTIPPRIKQMAIRAAALEDLTIAGVDVIINKNTGQAYVMEVNSAPQINSGSYIEEKTKVYAETIKQIIEKGMD